MYDKLASLIDGPPQGDIECSDPLTQEEAQQNALAHESDERTFAQYVYDYIDRPEKVEETALVSNMCFLVHQETKKSGWCMPNDHPVALMLYQSMYKSIAVIDTSIGTGVFHTTDHVAKCVDNILALCQKYNYPVAPPPQIVVIQKKTE